VQFKDSVHALQSTFIAQACNWYTCGLVTQHIHNGTNRDASANFLKNMITILHLNFLSNLVKQTFRVPALKGYWMSIVRQTHLSILHQTCSILNQIYLTRLINILWNVWAGQEGGWKWWPHFLESTIMTFLELCLSLQRAGTAYDLYREYQNHWPSGTGHTHTNARICWRAKALWLPKTQTASVSLVCCCYASHVALVTNKLEH